MWHYEYRLEETVFRYDAESYEACLTALIQTRAHSPHLTDLKIFEGGTLVLGSGIKKYDSREPVG